MKKTIIPISYILTTITISLFLLQSCNTSSYRKNNDGITVFSSESGGKPGCSVRLQVIDDKVIHVTAVEGNKFSESQSLIAVSRVRPLPEFTVESENDTVTLSTSALRVRVVAETGEVIFADVKGRTILAEKQGGGRSFENVTVDGKPYYAVRQQFESVEGEALYGLGANQTSFMNLKGKDADLFQYNTMAVTPFIISSANYGILWDNYSRTRFGDIREYDNISSLRLYDRDGNEGALTATYKDRSDSHKIFDVRKEQEINYQFIPDLKRFPQGYDLNTGTVTWEGSLESDTTGLHKFLFTSAGYARLWVDNELLFDRWRQCWNPSSNRFDLMMEQGRRYNIKIEWTPDGGESFIALKYLKPADQNDQARISFYSEVADQIDYYFISGESMDEVIRGYRDVTGKAPVMPEWAMGFWQSRERYTRQDELLSVVGEYRKRHIPIDNIVLDWQYWPIDKWGDHEFDPERFSDPAGMIATLHDSLHTHLMISVWAKYYVGTENYERMNSRGWLYKYNVDLGRKDWLGYVSTFYDAYNAEARQEFWRQINDKLYSKGVDAWWLDATEPDICSNLPMDERKMLMNPTALGPSSKYFNAFSLMQAQAVYDGQRATSPGSRVFILTRSAFAGLQRYSAANWSGDIAARWHDMKAQIPCALNFSMSGIPYWTMDIGGFAVESRYYNARGETLEEWREMMTRWFQFGAFCPLFRSHGQYPYREIYNIAPENHPAYRSMVYYDILRYRLMPYIYSLAGKVYNDDYTIMRGLAMDFPDDKKVFDIDDQYMFGPSILVSPVTDFKARSREVYLPEGAGWYDLFTGEFYEGGKSINVSAPYERIPLFIRAGAVIPFGPEIEYTSEKREDPVTLLIFTGTDGDFVLYEDEGINNNYEKGAFSVIPVTYSEADHSVTIGDRQGVFDGMITDRLFRIIEVSPGKSLGSDFDAIPYKEIKYDGSSLKVSLH